MPSKKKNGNGKKRRRKGVAFTQGGLKRGSNLSAAQEEFRHDVIESAGANKPEVDEGPHGRDIWHEVQRQICEHEGTVANLTYEVSFTLADGSTGTCIAKRSKTSVPARQWYFVGNDGNVGGHYTKSKAGTPRPRPADTKKVLVEDIQSRLDGQHELMCCLTEDMADIQREAVKRGLNVDVFPLIEDYAESHQSNQRYVKWRRLLEEEGKACDCPECTRYPLGHPRRSVIHQEIDHVGEEGRKVKADDGGLDPSQIYDQDVIDRQHPFVTLRCNGDHSWKDKSKIARVLAGDIPNVAANGGRGYSRCELLKYDVATEVTINRSGGRCTSSGVDIHRLNVMKIHHHHPTGTLATLVKRPGDKTDIVVDTCKHKALSVIVNSCRMGDFAALYARERSVTAPFYGLDHHYWHILDDNREKCVEWGIPLPVKREGYYEFELNQLPRLRQQLENLSDQQIAATDGFEIADWSSDGELLNVPAPPPAEEESSTIESSVATSQPRGNGSSAATSQPSRDEVAPPRRKKGRKRGNPFPPSYYAKRWYLPPTIPDHMRVPGVTCASMMPSEPKTKRPCLATLREDCARMKAEVEASRAELADAEEALTSLRRGIPLESETTAVALTPSPKRIVMDPPPLVSGTITSQFGGDIFTLGLPNGSQFSTRLIASEHQLGVIDGVLPPSLEQRQRRLAVDDFNEFIDAKEDGGKWSLVTLKLSVKSESDRDACKALCTKYRDRVASVKISDDLRLYLIAPCLQERCRCLRKTSRCMVAVVLKRNES